MSSQLHCPGLQLQTATRVAAAVTRSAGMQRFMAAGLQVGASLLVNKMKQLHTEAMEETGSGAAAASTIMYSSSSSTAQHSGLQSSSAADSKLSSLANRGSKAECIAASEPTAAAAAATPAATGWSGLAALRQAAAAAADGLASKQEQQEQQEQPAATQSAAGGSRTAAGQQLAEEQAAASVMHHHMLYCPGQLYYLKRSGELPAGFGVPADQLQLTTFCCYNSSYVLSARHLCWDGTFFALLIIFIQLIQACSFRRRHPLSIFIK